MMMEIGANKAAAPRDTYSQQVCYDRVMQIETEPAPPVLTSAPAAHDTEDAHCRQLITRIAGGDESALADLYDTAVGRAYALALRITRNAQDAEDAVEETFFQIWQRAAQYDAQRGRVLAWVLTICRSRALDLLRRHDPAELHADPAALDEQNGEAAEDPQHLLSMFQRDSAVHAALEQLSDVQRQLVALAFLRDLSHQQIAEYLDMPLGTVKTHIRKALSALQGLLDNDRVNGGG